MGGYKMKYTLKKALKKQFLYNKNNIVTDIYDITEKVSHRKLVEEENKQLEASIENMSDALYIIIW